MISLTVLVLLALASYRLTRLIVIDAIFDEIRDWFFKKLDFKKQKDGIYLNRTNIFIQKLSYLLQCTWCAGLYVSGFLVCLYLATWPWDLGVNGWLSVAGVAGGQGLLHAYEPAE